MSSMKELMKKLETDTTFVEDLKQSTSPEELATKLKAAGFDISLEELQQVLAPAESDELSDDELEAAAGGLNISKYKSKLSVASEITKTVGGLDNIKSSQDSIFKSITSGPSLLMDLLSNF